MYEESQKVLNYICNGLFSVGEDDFETRGVASLCKLLGRHNIFEKKFQQLRDHSYTTYAELKGGQSRTQWRKQQSFVVHMDAELPVWFVESS